MKNRNTMIVVLGAVLILIFALILIQNIDNEGDSGVGDNASWNESYAAWGVTFREPIKELHLTQEEKDWLEENPELLVATESNYPPFVFADGEDIDGLSIDYLNLLDNYLSGIKFNLAPSQPLSVNLEKAREGEFDIITSLKETSTRSEYLLFTEPYIEVPAVIIVRKEVEGFLSLEDMEGKKIAVGEGYAVQEYLENYSENLDLVGVTDDVVALRMLAFSEVDVAICDVASASYFIQKEGITNLRVAGDIDFTYPLSFASRKNAPILNSILDKALREVTEEEHGQILNKWLGIFTPREKLVELTAEEKAWIAEHPIVRADSEMNWRPFTYVEDNEPNGFSIDYLDLVASKVGLEIEYVYNYNWKEILQLAQDKELDIVHSLTQTPERSEYLIFTDPYTQNPTAVFINTKSEEVNSIYDVLDKKIAVVRGFYQIETLENKFPEREFDFYYVDDPLEGLQAVSLGKADVFLDFLAVGNALIKSNFITNVKASSLTGIKELDETPLYFAVRDDWSILRGILDKGLDAVTKEENDVFLNKWIGEGASVLFEKQVIILEFTPEEKAWIAEHPDIRLGVDPAWPPFEFVNELDVYQGIGADYVELMNDMLNLSMVPLGDLTWAEVMEKARNKEVDVLPTVGKTPQRTEYLLFTEPHTEVPIVLVAKSDTHLMLNLDELEGKKVVVVKNYITHEYLEADYPLIDLVLVQNVEEGLNAIEEGEALGIVDNLLTVNYELQRLGLEDYKVVLETEYMFDLRFAVRDDWPELVELLNKVLTAIPNERKLAIQDKWETAAVERRVDWGVVRKVALGIFVVAAIIIGFFIFWNISLSREIRKRKIVELELEKKSKKLEASNKLKDLFIDIMRHDLLNPAGLIKSNAQLALMDEKDAKRKEVLEKIERSSNRMIRMIENAPILAKLESGEKIEFKEENLGVLLKGSVEELSEKAKEKGMKLTIYAEGKFSAVVNPLIQNVFSNFISNAIKYSPKKTEIIVGIKEKDEDWLVYVEDRGEGIPTKYKKMVFERFTRLEKGAIKGSGLGLAISKKIVEAHNGKIWVRDHKDGGSVFYVLIPKVHRENVKEVKEK